MGDIQRQPVEKGSAKKPYVCALCIVWDSHLQGYELYRVLTFEFFNASDTSVKNAKFISQSSP